MKNQTQFSDRFPNRGMLRVSRTSVIHGLAIFLSLLGGLFLSALGRAAQIDIPGPAGSGAFGAAVTVLPNGNFVVTDPQFANGPAVNAGAVYLYSPSRILISSLTGSSANDSVGSGGAVVVGGTNFVVVSPSWHNVGAPSAGAVTWVNGSAGLSGVVSASNSLVGTTAGDAVGSVPVAALSNGNYVVVSPDWNHGVISAHVGSATWGDGASGISGPVSVSNSLVGATVGDTVGSAGVSALGNGNYVVVSPGWNNGVAGSHVGAATWGIGGSGVMGPVSAGNSLVGSTADDNVGINGVTALSNGNYVVISPNWNNGVASSKFGAATWGNGSSGTTGAVSASNSLIGTTANDAVGFYGVTVLSNGNYVVASSFWSNGAANDAGAVTWGDGTSGVTGPVSASNSLIGTVAGDQIGDSGVTALSNGNCVVASFAWSNGVVSSSFGAATWSNGSSGITGPVTSSNSLVGTTVNDAVGSSRVTALSNGNYVVVSPSWNNGVANSNFGAVTWGNGTSGITGPVSAGNSLIGTTVGDTVGSSSAIALSNGNYVVPSIYWNNGVAGNHVGAATWCNGSSGTTGAVSASNSLIGTTANDNVGLGVFALSNGNYVVDTAYWNNGVTNSHFGATTWGNGSGSIIGPVSVGNSLIGTTVSDLVGYPGVTALSDGNYLVASGNWSGNLGAVTLASGAFRLKGTIQSWNSVIGTAASGGPSIAHAYDPGHKQLIVGRPADNIVAVFTMDQIFAADFEP